MSAALTVPVTTLTTVSEAHALTRGPTPASARLLLRTGVVFDSVSAALDRIRPDGAADILDLGGGTGGLAVPLAQHGHRVTVVDPSPDSLAALDRRAAESQTTDRVRGIQGDAGAIAELIEPASMDLVLCHSVLEVVDDPGAAMAAATHVLRESGLISLLVANQVAAVVSRVSNGRLADAARLLADPDGRDGAHDPLARRFTRASLDALVVAAGLTVVDLHGVRVFSDVASAALIDEPQSAAALFELEQAASRDPDYLGFATSLHVICSRRSAVAQRQTLG